MGLVKCETTTKDHFNLPALVVRVLNKRKCCAVSRQLWQYLLVVDIYFVSFDVAVIVLFPVIYKVETIVHI